MLLLQDVAVTDFLLEAMHRPTCTEHSFEPDNLLCYKCIPPYWTFPQSLYPGVVY